MHKTATIALLLLAPACAPGGRRAAEPAPRDTITRPILRAVPTTQGYRQALQGGTRSATGQPGARYWQQAVSYRIEAELDPRTAELRGRERIVYRNRSPEALTSVVLNLYQNVFTETARRNRTIVAPTGGVTLARVAVEGRELRPVAAGQIGVVTPVRTPAAGYEVAGTLARLTLPRPVATGDSTVLEIEWSHRIPQAGTFRTAYEDALGGRAFNVAQWYPQIATFDDVIGWDATPYLGDGEFYLEYGDFDVSITLPGGHLVGATGVLQNSGEVLTPESAARLERALTTDSIVRVVTEAERAAGRATRTGSRLTWRFRAENVRDFAFAASDRYLWDAARATIAGGRSVLVHSLYRAGAPHWDEAARFGQHSIGFFSDRLVPYAYPQATIAEGPIGGMEYPMLVFIPRARERADLYSVIAHELAHEWFPMMVGSDEASFAWMDEGLTTFHEDDAREAFFPGTRAHDETRTAYLRVAGRDNEVPLMRHTDLVSPYGARTVAAYSKPGTMLVALRGVLGRETFDRAMRTYATEWMFKHPYPWDFFNTFERVAGRDLDWFFYPWWFETGTLDYAVGAVGAVRAVNGGVEVTITDLGDIPAPVRVTATGEGGASASVDIPLESWTGARTRTATFTLPLGAAPTRVEVDPAGTLPDVNRANNVWPAAAP